MLQSKWKRVDSNDSIGSPGSVDGGGDGQAGMTGSDASDRKEPDLSGLHLSGSLSLPSPRRYVATVEATESFSLQSAPTIS